MKLTRLAAALMVGTMAVSCHCHHGDEPEMTPKYNVRVHLDNDKWLYLYEKENESRGEDSLALRYTVWAVRPGSDKPEATAVTIGSEVDLKLPEGRFRVMAFADYVDPENVGKDKYFFTDDYRELLVMDKYGYKGNDEHSQSYWTAADVDVVKEHNCPLYLTLKPTMARVKVVATDTPKFEVGTVRMSFPETVPSAINGYDGRINYRWADVSFDAEPQKKMLTGDYFYAPLDQDSIMIRVEIYDKEGKLSARKKFLKIPYIRRGITTVCGPFYNTLEVDSVPTKPSGGGVGIDPSFDSTVEIPV